MLDHILIVDESRLVREALAKIILSCGVDKTALSCLESADDAIEYGQISPVSLLICSDSLSQSNYHSLRDSLAHYSNIETLPLLLLAHKAEHVNADLSRLQTTPLNAEQRLLPPFSKQRVIDALYQLTKNTHFAQQVQHANVIGETMTDVLNTEKESDSHITLDDAKPTVLVVDDETSNIDVVAGNLRQLYRVMVAKSGEHALKIVANNKHNIRLILLDIMMPGMDGYQVCQILKVDKASAAIPVIFLSAKSLVEDIKYGFDLGAVDYVTKPLNGDILRARVATHIRLQQQKLALSSQITTLKENAQLREDIEKITQHDLKAPLNNILFETYKLTDKKAAKSINNAVNNVVNMINNSLNLYKIEQGMYDFMPQVTNLNTLVNDAINAVHNVANDKHIIFDLNGFETDHLMLAEPLLCLSIFNNLIKNAVEASPSNHAITVNLITCNKQVQFSITNYGVIPKPIRATLFEKYSSSDHRTGVGLGTYSAQLMTKIQRGDIYFTIIDELQTHFVVTLPAA